MRIQTGHAKAFEKPDTHKLLLKYSINGKIDGIFPICQAVLLLGVLPVGNLRKAGIQLEDGGRNGMHSL